MIEVIKGKSFEEEFNHVRATFFASLPEGKLLAWKKKRRKVDMFTLRLFHMFDTCKSVIEINVLASI